VYFFSSLFSPSGVSRKQDSKSDRRKHVLPELASPAGLESTTFEMEAILMAPKIKLKDAAKKIRSAARSADVTAHQAVRKSAKAANATREELKKLSKQVEALKKQLQKSAVRLRKALG
jgi:hypothetical protein